MPSTHHLDVTVTDRPAVLERVVSACRSRQCVITALHFEAGDRHRPGRLRLTLEGAPRMVGLASTRLGRLVDVVAVERAGAPVGPGEDAADEAREPALA